MKKGGFDILNYISDNFVLFQLIDTAGDLNRAVSIIGCWIYNSIYKRALPLIKESLNCFLRNLKTIMNCILNLNLFSVPLVM